MGVIFLYLYIVVPLPLLEVGILISENLRERRCCAVGDNKGFLLS